MEMEKNWYVVHTYSGYENKVKANLEARVETMGMQDKIFRVVIPEEEETDFKDGKKRTVMKKTFPGYVLVEIIMTDDSWYVVRNTPGVTGFIGSSGGGAKPTPLLEEEVEFILKQMGVKERKAEIDFAIGEMIQVLEGPFANFQGKIEEIDEDKGKVKVAVDMFGRETKMELDFEQIQKIIIDILLAQNAEIVVSFQRSDYQSSGLNELSNSTGASRQAHIEWEGQPYYHITDLRRCVSWLKKLSKIVKLQIPAGKANPAPPVGPALGQAGVNIMGFCKEFNARTADQAGLIIPVEISVFEDRSFTFITKTPPAAVLLKVAANLKKVQVNRIKRKLLL